MPSIINKKAVREHALKVAEKRSQKFTRVSDSFLADCDSHLKAWIAEHVRYLPSVGKTIK